MYKQERNNVMRKVITTVECLHFVFHVTNRYCKIN